MKEFRKGCIDHFSIVGWRRRGKAVFGASDGPRVLFLKAEITLKDERRLKNLVKEISFMNYKTRKERN